MEVTSQVGDRYETIVALSPRLAGFVPLYPEMAGKTHPPHLTEILDAEVIEEAIGLGGLMLIKERYVAVAIPKTVSMRSAIALARSIEGVGINGLDSYSEHHDPVETDDWLVYIGLLD